MIFNSIISFLSKIFLFTGKLGTSKIFNFDKKLSKDKEREYFLRLKKAKENKSTDTEAEEILTKHNLRLVAHIAKKYKSNYSDSDDLISIGSIGLIKAVRTYDLDKCKNFSSYASKCIENEMLMVLRSEKKLSNEVSMDTSLGSDQDGNELTIADTLFDTKIDLEQSADKKNSILKLKKTAKKILNNREYEIITRRYGLDGNIPATQKEVSEILKISRSYISRIETIAIEKLKQSLMKNKKASN